MRPSPAVRLKSGPRAETSSGARALPPGIAFLRSYGVGLPVLQRAASRAAREAVPASDWIIASGGVSALLFYQALADHLGLPFMRNGVTIASDVAASAAILRGVARLAEDAPAAWLLAPRGHTIDLLLEGRRLGHPQPDALLTTPGRLSWLVRRADAAAMATLASEALPCAAPALSAKDASGPYFLALLGAAALVLGIAVIATPTLVAIAAGLLFFAASVFRLLVCAAGLDAVPMPQSELADADLPHYAVLVPLYREAGMVAKLASRLDALDYPRAKLEIRLLVEPDDVETQLACLQAPLGAHVEVVVAPRGEHPTKPRALNVALPLLRGTLLTVFDAEDAPEPQQLRRAAARFHQAPADLACLQASLFIDNGGKNLLTRLFSLDYAALFDVFNQGIGRLRLPMALGGTSNHFRVAAVRAVGGWDAWNVAEDADLGLRLARFGFRTETLAVTTAEEAPHELGNWFRQRRRWTKGWMQTAIVLGRRPIQVWREIGTRASAAVALQLAGLVVAPLASLPLTVLMLTQLWLYGLPASATWTGWAAATLWACVFILGPASALWPAFVGARARRMRVSPWVVLALLPYQMLVGLAAWGGFIDLIVRPYHWHKTRHGTGSSAWPQRLDPARPRRLGRRHRAPAARA